MAEKSPSIDLPSGGMPYYSATQPHLTAKQLRERTKREVQKYSFFNPNLKEQFHKNGDIYDDKLRTTQSEWGIER
jgi:hypothetical protein